MLDRYLVECLPEFRDRGQVFIDGPVVGSEVETSSEHEWGLGLDRPPVVYAMFESAITTEAARSGRQIVGLRAPTADG